MGKKTRSMRQSASRCTQGRSSSEVFQGGCQNHGTGPRLQIHRRCLQLFPLLYTSGMEDEVRTIICLSVDSHFRGPHGEEIWRAIWSCSNWANMARACRIESHGRKKLEAIVLLLICWQMRQKGCKINVNLK